MNQLLLLTLTDGVIHGLGFILYSSITVTSAYTKQTYTVWLAIFSHSRSDILYVSFCATFRSVRSWV